jgi:NADH-quinone oxidoreductase subunit F
MAKKKRIELMLCAGTACVAGGAFQFMEALKKELKAQGLKDDVAVVATGCNGFCGQGPLMVVLPENIFYGWLSPEEIPHLVEEHFLKGRPVKKLMFTPPEEEQPLPLLSDIPFFKKQMLVVLRNKGIIDPEKIEDYIARDGYAALEKVLTSMKPGDVIDEIVKSGLRGRGGAGFPTGRKWLLTRQQEQTPKYLIANCDEGDPGAYMDRSLLESDPHSLLEGLTIAAYAVGAANGFIYVRTEYQLAIERIKKAISQSREYGLLGTDILGTGFDFNIELREGSGAFVCGEETSLIHSIEGNIPEPRQRPPFPAKSGLWGFPTLINNVETMGNVPMIIEKGADWYSGIGTKTSKGTKIFSLVGKINNTGLIEVPMGITLRDVVYGIGGGIPGGKRFKAVQTGGPSGGCIPASMLDSPIDYETLKAAGSMMGSGGMIVLDEDTCVVDVSKFFVQFTNDESCGKCVSCREGSEALLEVLTRIADGNGKEGDIEFLEELCETIKDASMCGLGQSLPNPVLSTLQFFRDEYEAHIKQKHCPAVVCKGIISSSCQHICPLEQDVSCYIGLIAQGNFEEAIKIVRKENPLPLICGRVCDTPCEAKCKAGDGGDPISIRALKRFLADYEMNHDLPIAESPKNERDERAAVIGSGPAGLSCAYYLTMEGYKVTVFESLPTPGGMLAVGIPGFRLPKEVLNWEIERMMRLGVEIRTNTRVGKDILLSELKEDYDAIFIATGAHKGLRMKVPGEDSGGVLDAVEFLRDFNLGREVEIGDRVIIVGGGNSAIDAARVAKRLGKDTSIIYRRTRAEMPAIKSEIDEALLEEIDIRFMAAPVKVLSNNGKIEALECIRMKMGDVDESNRRRPVPIPGSEFRVDADTLILAISQKPDVSFLSEEDNLKVSGWNTMQVDPENLLTSVEGIFAGGDLVTGPNNVTEAIAHGKLAAKMIDKYIKKEPLERTYEVTRPTMRVESSKLSEEEIENLKKPVMATIQVAQRIGSFDEVELGFSEAEAIAEAKRCLRCDLEN